jgi:lipopolysaccharide/colanic/teichoic acid biosynthesis glycosyltransferase
MSHASRESRIADRGAGGRREARGVGVHADARARADHARSAWDRLTRRALDLAIAVPTAVISFPVVVLAAIVIRLESPGGALFRQTRAGLHGETFTIYKLRTMVSGAEHFGAGLAVLDGDSRITRSGAFLRRYSLDELPNLWNVIRGEMSIVGPRPTLTSQVEQYTEHQRRRLDVPPGITGWAQINGRASLPWAERIELDIWYVEHRTLRLDLKILARTIGQVRSGRGLYHPDASGGWKPPAE